MFETSLGWHDLVFMLQGAGITLAMTALSVAAGTAMGLGFGVVRATCPWLINAPLGLVLDVFRSVPLLIQFVLAVSIVSITRISIAPFVVACVVLSLYTAAYCTEIVRGGILAVPRTTRRAARSLGMTAFQDFVWVVFPIALRVALPNWITLMLGVMKDSSLALWIGVIELLRSSQIVVTRIQEPLFVLSIVGLIYFLMSFPIARLGARYERRWREND